MRVRHPPFAKRRFARPGVMTRVAPSDREGYQVHDVCDLVAVRPALGLQQLLVSDLAMSMFHRSKQTYAAWGV